MGRKGTSKRKPSQTKSKLSSSGNASGSVSAALKAAESQPAKSFDTGKAAASTGGSAKTSTDRKKDSKKG